MLIAESIRNTDIFLDNINLTDIISAMASVISAICSVISLIAIIMLIIDRIERKRPYLQVSSELLRSNLACVVIRNVGEVPAKITSIGFDNKFTEQLQLNIQDHLKNRNNLNLSIYPKQMHVISLDDTIGKMMELKNTQLEVTLKYCAIGKNKIYTETEVINFKDHGEFLNYISETDELRREIKELNSTISNMSKVIDKYLEHNYVNFVDISTLSDDYAKKIITKIENETTSSNSAELSEQDRAK